MPTNVTYFLWFFITRNAFFKPQRCFLSSEKKLSDRNEIMCVEYVLDLSNYIFIVNLLLSLLLLFLLLLPGKLYSTLSVGTMCVWAQFEFCFTKKKSTIKIICLVNQQLRSRNRKSEIFL